MQPILAPPNTMPINQQRCEWASEVLQVYEDDNKKEPEVGPTDLLTAILHHVHERPYNKHYNTLTDIAVALMFFSAELIEDCEDEPYEEDIFLADLFDLIYATARAASHEYDTWMAAQPQPPELSIGKQNHKLAMTARKPLKLLRELTNTGVITAPRDLIDNILQYAHQAGGELGITALDVLMHACEHFDSQIQHTDAAPTAETTELHKGIAIITTAAFDAACEWAQWKEKRLAP